jgi:DNA-binding transcriptional MerR regulator
MLVQGALTKKFHSKGCGVVTGTDPDRARGVYGITVAAELVGTGVQNLRAYEARGLLQPDRTQGGSRRYSADDLDRLRRIGDLLDAGLNLAGIAMVLDLQDQNDQLRATNDPPPPNPAEQSPPAETREARTRKQSQPSTRTAAARSAGSKAQPTTWEPTARSTARPRVPHLARATPRRRTLDCRVPRPDPGGLGRG